MRNLLNNSTIKSLLPSLSRAAAAYEGSSVDLKGKGRKILVIVDAGTFVATATLDVRIQSSPVTGFGSGVIDEYILAQKTAAGTWVFEVVPTQNFVRALAVVGNAAVVFSVEGIIYLERAKPSGI